MYLRKLSLVNFKNFDSKTFNFEKKINCFVGQNGVGKTNILDAIYYLSFTKSYFVYTGLTTECEAINIDSDTGKVEYMGGTYDSLAEFYGCVDEDQESIQGIRIRD